MYETLDSEDMIEIGRESVARVPSRLQTPEAIAFRRACDADLKDIPKGMSIEFPFEIPDFGDDSDKPELKGDGAASGGAPTTNAGVEGEAAIPAAQPRGGEPTNSGDGASVGEGKHPSGRISDNGAPATEGATTMAKVTDGGWLPPDDPIYRNGPQIVRVLRPKPPTAKLGDGSADTPVRDLAQAGGDAGEIAGYSAVIDMPDAPVERKAEAFYNRGMAKDQAGDAGGAEADWRTSFDIGL